MITRDIQRNFSFDRPSIYGIWRSFIARIAYDLDFLLLCNSSFVYDHLLSMQLPPSVTRSSADYALHQSVTRSSADYAGASVCHTFICSLCGCLSRSHVICWLCSCLSRSHVICWLCSCLIRSHVHLLTMQVPQLVTRSSADYAVASVCHTFICWLCSCLSRSHLHLLTMQLPQSVTRSSADYAVASVGHTFVHLQPNRCCFILKSFDLDVHFYLIFLVLNFMVTKKNEKPQVMMISLQFFVTVFN